MGERRKLTAEHTPMELGNIGSLADLPIPTPISNLFNKPAADTPEKPKRKKNREEKEKPDHRHLLVVRLPASVLVGHEAGLSHEGGGRPRGARQAARDGRWQERLRAQQNEWTRRLPFAHSSGDARAEEESLEVDRRERKREEGSESQRDQPVCKEHHLPLDPRVPVDPTGRQVSGGGPGPGGQEQRNHQDKVSWGAFPHRGPQRLPDSRQRRKSLQQTNCSIIKKAGTSRPNRATCVSARF